MDPFRQHLQGTRQSEAPLRRLLEEVVRQPDCRLFPDPRELGQLRRQVIDRGHQAGDGGRGTGTPVLSCSSNRKLEGEVQASGQLPHLVLRQLGRLLLRVVHGDHNHVLEHLDVRLPDE